MITRNFVSTNSSDNEIICEYFDFLRDSKHASENTLQAYSRDLNRFLVFLDSCNTHILDADNDVLSDYRTYLLRDNLSDSSICRLMSSVRGLYKYLVSYGIMDTNPSKVLKNTKQDKTPDLDILSNDEVDKLLAQPDVNDLKGLRDKAMLEVLYSTGLKVTELISLNLEDVNLRLGYIHCRGNSGGKAKSDRMILLYPLAVKFLTQYIEKARRVFILSSDEVDEQDALFVNTSGGRMTRQGFWKLLKGYASSANISKNITPIALRHSFAAHLIENGAELSDIKEILGHASLSSTMVYENYLKSKISASYLKFHPRA